MGTATITVASTDDSTKSASATIGVYEPVKITAQPTTAYNNGTQKLSFSVTFDAAVSVTAGPNNTWPQFAFTITRADATPQTKDKIATYTSGSGTATLVFEYARENYGYGDINYAADPIALNGGTIQDAQGKAVLLIDVITAQDAAATIGALEIGVGIAADTLATKIPDANFSASPAPRSGGEAYKGRLNDSGAWRSAYDKNGTWWQVNLGSVMSLARIQAQGPGNASNGWLGNFEVWYSLDGTNWQNGGSFWGTSGRYDTVTHTFGTPFDAQYVRVYPKTWTSSLAARFELIPTTPGYR